MLSRRQWIAAVAAVPAYAADSQWRVVRQPQDQAAIVDLSVGQGIAVTVGEPGILLTPDGGESWRSVKFAERASSAFALDADHLWVVAESGVWFSADQGVSWKRQFELQGLERVYFLDSAHGFACGAGRTIVETADGGDTWKRVPAADEPDTSAAHTVYSWIHFVTPRAGIITGVSRPPRAGNTGPLPAWRDSMPSLRRREWPGASITLETRDAGATWKHSVTSLFGRITRVRYSRDGHGLAVVEFHDAFEWPSEVFGIEIRTGQSTRVFRESNRAVTDAVVFSATRAYLAAVEPPADPAESNLGKLRVLHSGDLETWREMELPREFPAGRAIFAAPSPDDLWVATDTGYVLKLVTS